MGITLVMYFNYLASIKLILKYIHMPLHYRSLLMGRLYTHNSLRDAKEQFEIMFINDVLQNNEYSLAKNEYRQDTHAKGLSRREAPPP